MIIPPIQCSVVDLKGNHCPEPVIEILVIDEKVFYLCNDCYINVMNGAYGLITTTSQMLHTL